MSIQIQGVSKEETGYDKRITFEREGVEYSVFLHWDAYDGYELHFVDGRKFIPNPDWVNEWQDEVSGQSLELSLDELSEEAMV
jgi:hypothetical protein